MAEKKAFALRINQDLFDEIQRLAASELRSVNGQIEYLLREALRAHGRKPRARQDGAGPEGAAPV